MEIPPPPNKVVISLVYRLEGVWVSEMYKRKTFFEVGID